MKNHLNTNHYTMPGVAYQTMTKQQLKETLLSVDGSIMACGRLCDIKSKYLGAGVYKVWVEKRKY